MRPLTLFLFASCLPIVQLLDLKALDEYVNRSDPHYEYERVKAKTDEINIYDVHFDTINMTSLKWLNETEVDKPVWSHELKIAVSTRIVTGKSCLLIINPGQTDTSGTVSYFSSKNELIHLTITTKSTVAVLNPLPLQPLTFYKHPLGRENISGYDILAYSWWRFINDSSVLPEELVEFPMVKATVRAMDTVISYMMKTYKKTITKFILTGTGMNGWTAWLTAAVDKRVNAIIPTAMDFLNFKENFLHHYRAYCGWSYGLKPLIDMNITQKLDDPRFALLASHVDPLEYNERYINISKYIIVLSGDEVFQPDNFRYYFDQLEGPKYLNIVPNADYRVNNTILLYTFTIFCRYIVNDKSLPRTSWESKMTNSSITIILRGNDKIYRVYSFHADTVDDTRRDFRSRIPTGNSTKNSPVKWIKTELNKSKQNVYVASVQKPNKGWRAFFFQVHYVSAGASKQFIETSEMLIIPDSFPCPDCNGEECQGTLV